MAFKKKAKKPQSASNVDWNKFNRHIEERVEAAIEENGVNMECYVSMLIDSGTQPAQDPFTEYEWEDSDQQNKLLKKDFGCYVEDGKFYIPNRPMDSIILAVDFPDIMVDYGRFFSEDNTSEERPYRHFLAGDWEGVAGYTAAIVGKDGAYSARSTITKIAKAANLVKGSKVKEDFNIGDLMGAVFTMDVEVSSEEKGDKFYTKVKATNLSARSKKLPPLECDIECIGIMMNLDEDDEPYVEEELRQINSKVIKRLEMAEEWEDSDLKKALEKLGKLSSASSSSSSKGENKKPASSSKKKSVEQEPDEELGEDDDNPFALDEDED